MKSTKFKKIEKKQLEKIKGGKTTASAHTNPTYKSNSMEGQMPSF